MKRLKLMAMLLAAGLSLSITTSAKCRSWIFRLSKSFGKLSCCTTGGKKK